LVLVVVKTGESHKISVYTAIEIEILVHSDLYNALCKGLKACVLTFKE